jgi:hypothetical protein
MGPSHSAEHHHSADQKVPHLMNSLFRDVKITTNESGEPAALRQMVSVS